MFYATTTCAAPNPDLSQTCTSVYDAGDLMFILAFILFFVSLPGIGLFFNAVLGKKT